MTDNRTTEQNATERLRVLLDERGVEWWWSEGYGTGCVFTWWESPTFGEVHAMDNEDGKLFMACLNNRVFTPEQAVAATLGGVDSSADDALALLDEIREADRISYDDYSRLFDAIATLGGVNPDGLPNGLTLSDDGTLLNWRGENYVIQGSGTLTAEQVREAIEKRFDFDVWVPPARWKAIADELNGEIGGTCEFVDCGVCKFYHADIQLCEYGIPPCSKFERKPVKR